MMSEHGVVCVFFVFLSTKGTYKAEWGCGSTKKKNVYFFENQKTLKNRVFLKMLFFYIFKKTLKNRGF